MIEGILRLLRHRPHHAWRLPFWLLKGKSHLKARLARAVEPPKTAPPVNRELLVWLEEEKAEGRKILLVTASHEEALGPVRDLFPFDEILASDDETNLKGRTKAALLVGRFGEKGFDYVGDSASDEAVRKHSRKAIPVLHSRRRLASMEKRYDCPRTFCTNPTPWPDWVRAIRVHQWANNLLIALPFLAGHHFHTIGQLAGLAAAFLAMSLCASGTYLWNDLLDIEYDRAHPRKRDRLAASGRTSLQRILIASSGLVAAGLIGGFANDVHGKNHHRADCLGNHVPRFELLRSDGTRTVLSEGNPRHAATIGGLGLTGIITWAELQLVPIRSAQLDVELVRFSGLDEFLELSKDSEPFWEHTVAWIDCAAAGSSLGRGIFIRGNWSAHGSLDPHKPPGASVPVDFPNFALNRFSISAFNTLYYRRQP